MVFPFLGCPFAASAAVTGEKWLAGVASEIHVPEAFPALVPVPPLIR